MLRCPAFFKNHFQHENTANVSAKSGCFIPFQGEFSQWVMIDIVPGFEDMLTFSGHL